MCLTPSFQTLQHKSYILELIGGSTWLRFKAVCGC
jgi:hypothetical protein